MNIVAPMIIFFTSFNAGSAIDYYCRDTPQDLYTLTGINQIKTLTEGNPYYLPNASCEFPIETMESRRIKLTVELSDLHTPDYLLETYCEPYDHVDVYDGDGKKLVTWCGRTHPKEIISKGHALKVVFKSNQDDNNNGLFRGVRIRIQTFDNTSCPPGWLDHNNSCYATTLTKQSWAASQIECNQRQSNLLSVNFHGSLTFLKKEILNKSSELYLWTGLNGVLKEDQLVWLDKSSPRKMKGFAIPGWDDLRRCGVIHTKLAAMYMQDCSQNTMYALCQSKKNEITLLYPTSVQEQYFAAPSDDSGQILLAVCIPIIILICLAIGIYIALDRMGYPMTCFESSYDGKSDNPEQRADFLPSTSHEMSTIEL